MEFDEILAKVNILFRGIFPEKEICLYLIGSRAEGTAGKYSDFDFAIVSDAPLDRKRLSKLRSNIEELKTLYAIEIVDLNHASEDFKNIARRTMKEVR